MRLIIRDQLALMQHNYLIYGIRNFLDIVIHHNDRFAQPVQLPHQTEYFIPSNWIKLRSRFIQNDNLGL